MNVTFLGAVAQLVTLGAVPTVDAGSPLFLKQLVHSLDDALQRFIHVDPHFLLTGQRHTGFTQFNLLLWITTKRF